MIISRIKKNSDTISEIKVKRKKKFVIGEKKYNKLNSSHNFLENKKTSSFLKRKKII